MAKILLLTIVLLSFKTVFSQIVIPPNFTKEELAALHAFSKKGAADTSRVRVYLQLAHYHLRRWDLSGKGVDSASAYIKEAREINARQSSRKLDGVVLLYESSLTLRNGDTSLAKIQATSAIKLLEPVGENFHAAMGYLELSRCFDLENPAQAFQMQSLLGSLFSKLPQLVSQKDRKNWQAELFRHYSTRMRGDPPHIKRFYLQNFISYAHSIGERTNEFWARKEVADVRYQEGETATAIKELIVLAKEQEAGGYNGTCFTYDLLAGLYFASDSFHKALQYAILSTKNIRTKFEASYRPRFFGRVASIYGATGNLALAAQWNREMIDDYIATKQTGSVYTDLDRLVNIMIELGKKREALTLVLDIQKRVTPYDLKEKRGLLLCLAQCYKAVGKNQTAERFCIELITVNEIRVRNKEIISDPFADQFLAFFFLDVNQLERAEKYFKLAVKHLPQQVGATNHHYFYFRLDSLKGNYLSAIRHLQSSQRREDSMLNAVKTGQIEELKVTYETEKKDKQLLFNEQNISLLREQDRLQKNKIEQQALIRNIIFAVVALLVVIIALLFNRFREKQRTNKKLEYQRNEIAQRNYSLQHLLDEKEWLVKEIHHRVKNNLQIVMSLLNSQSAYLDKGPALVAITDSQHRVQAMSLIHQKLYGPDNVSSIDMSLYIRELVSYLAQSFDTGQRIRFEYSIERLELDVSQAVPLGLILNEAITNAIKYAFPGGKKGVISVSFTTSDEGHYMLIISDNGMGFPSHTSMDSTGSLGMSLLHGLSEDLNGNLSIRNDHGTRLEVSFAPDNSLRRTNPFVDSAVLTITH